MNSSNPGFIPTGAECLDRAGFSAAFKDAWHNTKSSFRKFEGRQSYREPENPSLAAFEHGDIGEAQQLLKAGLGASMGLYRDAREREIICRRVRPVIEPLTDYLQWELLSYRLSIAEGEDIRVFDGARHPEFCFPQISDFVIFDDLETLYQNYDETGLLVGGWSTKDPDVVAAVSRIFSAMWEISQPLPREQ